MAGENTLVDPRNGAITVEGGVAGATFTIDALTFGSHAYGYNGANQMVTDAWTFLGVTRTKTYTYTSGILTSESDWV